MKTIKILSLVVFATLIGSCSPVKVLTDINKETDFSRYQTYSFLGWLDDSDQVLNEFDRKRIKDAFVSEFESRGLKLVKENGDMEVSLFIVIDQKTSVSAYTDYFGGPAFGMYSRFGGGWGYGHATTTYHESDYLVGTLVMDVFDGAAKDQIWQGIASRTVDENPQKRDKSIPAKIETLMKEFPVEPTV